MKQIDLIPLLQAYDFDSELEDELAIAEINTHYSSDIAFVDWDDEEDLPILKKWLVDEYGDEIKKYTKFAINPT